MKHRNPILPIPICVPDAEARVCHDGSVYLYGSRDLYADSFCSDSYYSVHSRDLSEWICDPVPSFTAGGALWAKSGTSAVHSSLSGVTSFDDLPAHIRKVLPEEAKNVPVGQLIAAIEQSAQAGLPKEIRLYAPDAIEKDGKTYLYFCMSDDSEGVAVSDRPGGPFRDAVRLPVSGIDPAVFIDHDGAAYYYWGQFQANAARLNPDMCSIDAERIRTGVLTEEEHHFHEGSSMRRRGDIYYYVFADTSRGKPTCLGYATGSSPLGPFTYRGVIIDNVGCDPGSWNNHGSIAEIDGQWYVFYHRSSNNSQYSRRVCMEPIFFDENGLIHEVQMTSQGAGEPYRKGETIPAYEVCECLGRCWLDTRENPFLRLEEGGEAVWRYLELTDESVSLRLEGRGNANLEIRIDGYPVARVKPGETYDLKTTAGLHTLSVKSDQDFELERIMIS